MSLFISNSSLPSKFFSFAIFWKVVVAHKNAGLVWKHHDPLDGFVEQFGRTSWKVTSSSAIVGHEECITREERITDQVAHTSRRMARRVDDACRQLTKSESFTISKEFVKLRSISLKIRAQIEDSCKNILNQANILTNGNVTTQLFTWSACAVLVLPDGKSKPMTESTTATL